MKGTLKEAHELRVRVLELESTSKPTFSNAARLFLLALTKVDSSNVMVTYEGHDVYDVEQLEHDKFVVRLEGGQHHDVEIRTEGLCSPYEFFDLVGAFDQV